MILALEWESAIKGGGGLLSVAWRNRVRYSTRSLTADRGFAPLVSRACLCTLLNVIPFVVFGSWIHLAHPSPLARTLYQAADDHDVKGRRRLLSTNHL